ncbi:MAG: FAD-binding protein [Chitinivibrionales bacterium]|nr:FAD-binding protein [Chitinivibrionales bacterium]
MKTGPIVARDVHRRFHVRDTGDLKRELDRLGLELPVDSDMSTFSGPVKSKEITFPNRFVAQPMEGFDSGPDGSPGELSFRRYHRYARGGFGLIWGEATAVLHEARSNPCQLFLNSRSVDAFSRLVESTRNTAGKEHGWNPVMVLQLTHSGRYSKPDGIPKSIIAHHSKILDPKHNLPGDYPLVSDEYLDRLQDTFVDAAKLAAQAGFDGVDIKSCHRYLVSELLASHTREGKYGGSYENRTRFVRETMARVNDEVPGIFVTTRMNAYDAIEYPYGWGVDKDDFHVPDPAEPQALARDLESLGIPVLNVTVGNPYFNPHVNRPYDFTIQGMEPYQEDPLYGVHRFISITRMVQEAIPAVPVIASGYSWLRHLIPDVASGVIKTGGASLLGFGRSAFAYPDAPVDIMRDGKMDPAKCCITCSACTQIMRDGGHTGCVIRDSEVYGPEYRKARRYALDRLKEAALRCRECETPTCSNGCPAHVHVPAFVKAFADDDIPRAYQILKDNNVLPELCAYVCPAEVQCEGNCIESILCGEPVPIRDIQMAVCRLARRKKLTGLKLPEKMSGKKVALVGGGPAGVAAAIALLEKGHEVTIYEKEKELGGTPDTIIPSQRYTDSGKEIEAILGPVGEQNALEIKTGAVLGRTIRLHNIIKEHDAVLLAMGLSKSARIGHAEGVVDALSFLGEIKRGERSTVPPQVAVLGGGSTAMDAGTTAIALGAKDVYLVYRRSFNQMPAWPAERDSFLAKGGHILVLTQPVGYATDESGRLTGLRTARTVPGPPDDSGRPRPEVLENSESILPVDLVIEALGQKIDPAVLDALDGIQTSKQGLITTRNGSSETSVDGIFAAGDCISGGTTVVQSVAEGMRAAAEIDRYLHKK